MKKILFFGACFIFLTTCAFSSEYSKYAAKECAKNFNADNARIVLKKEHIEIFAQEVGQKFIPYVVYGYGDLKIKHLKKQRITYICLLDFKLNPVWSEIYISDY